MLGLGPVAAAATTATEETRVSCKPCNHLDHVDHLQDTLATWVLQHCLGLLYLVEAVLSGN